MLSRDQAFDQAAATDLIITESKRPLIDYYGGVEHHSSRKIQMMRLLKYALIAAGTLFVLVFVLPFLFLVWIFYAPSDYVPGGRDGQFRDKATARVPGLSLTLERRFAHPFLAEYHRSLTVEQEGTGTTELKLEMDTGGITRIKVCRSRTGSILVHDYWQTYEATRGRTRPSLIPEPSLKNDCSEFLGAFDVDAEKDLSFRPGKDSSLQ